MIYERERGREGGSEGERKRGREGEGEGEGEGEREGEREGEGEREEGSNNMQGNIHVLQGKGNAVIDGDRSHMHKMLH